MKWMVDTVIDGVSVKDRWLIPQNEVNVGIVYAGCPVGNSPEFIPCYNSLNADVTRSHGYHCVLINKLGGKGTLKFSMKSPELIVRGIKRLLENEWKEGFPTSEKIIYDYDLGLDIINIFYQAGGTIVPELLNRIWNCYSKDGTGKHGGARVKSNPGKTSG